MELRHLRYFVAVAEELNFGRAARRVRVAQPALSTQIRSLETELGVRLLDRNRRRVLLTPAGEVFLDEARGVLAQAETAARRASEAAGGLRGTLRLGAITSFRHPRLHEVIQRQRRTSPGVKFEFTDRTPAGLERALVAREVDVAFLRPPVTHPELAVQVVEVAELMVVLPEQHPLTRRRSVRWQDLVEEDFIQLADDESPGFNMRLRELTSRNGFVPRIRHACREMHTIVWLVSLGMGLSVMVTGMRHLLIPGVSSRLFAPPRPTIETLMAWRRDDASPVLREFLRIAIPQLSDSTPQ